MIRLIGNFGVHPSENQITNCIVDVTPEEAEWSLEVIRKLFEFFYVEPTKQQERKTELNVKLREMGKPEIE